MWLVASGISKPYFSQIKKGNLVIVNDETYQWYGFFCGTSEGNGWRWHIFQIGRCYMSYFWWNHWFLQEKFTQTLIIVDIRYSKKIRQLWLYALPSKNDDITPLNCIRSLLYKKTTDSIGKSTFETPLLLGYPLHACSGLPRKSASTFWLAPHRHATKISSTYPSRVVWESVHI